MEVRVNVFVLAVTPLSIVHCLLSILYSTLNLYSNHYLKSAPAPIWMTQGKPAKLKGITTGYTYDPTGNCGKDCKVCKQWNDRMAEDSIATMQEIDRRKKEDHWE